MALINPSYVTKYGVTADNVYIRVCDFFIDMNRDYVNFRLGIYKDKQSRLADVNDIVESRQIFVRSEVDANGVNNFTTFFDPKTSTVIGNNFTQTYDYLKSLPEFSGCIDDI